MNGANRTKSPYDAAVGRKVDGIRSDGPKSSRQRDGVHDDKPTRNLELWTGPQLNQQISGHATRLLGHAKYSLDTQGFRTPPTMLKASLEHSWRWRESNPRPSVPHQGFSGRSLLRFSQPRRSCKQDADRLSRC